MAFSVNKGGTDQAGDSNTWTRLGWSIKDFDTNNSFAADRFTPTTAGKYLLTLTLECAATTGICAAAIYKNGASYTYSQIWTPSGSVDNFPSVSAVVDMNGTSDYVEAYVFDTGTTI